MIFTRVDATNFMSCRLAGAPSIASGRPPASVSRLRLTPPLPRSVGLGPVFFPAQWGLGQGAIEGQPIPVNALEFVVFQQAKAPKGSKHTRIDPVPKAPVRRRAGTDAGAVQRIPLHARTQYQQDGIHGGAVWNPRPMTAQWMRFRRWQ